MDVYLSVDRPAAAILRNALQPVDLGFDAVLFLAYAAGQIAGIPPHVNPVRLSRVTPHNFVLRDTGAVRRLDPFGGVLLVAVQPGENIDVSILPSERIDRICMIDLYTLGFPIFLRGVDYIFN